MLRGDTGNLIRHNPTTGTVRHIRPCKFCSQYLVLHKSWHCVTTTQFRNQCYVYWNVSSTIPTPAKSLPRPFELANLRFILKVTTATRNSNSRKLTCKEQEWQITINSNLEHTYFLNAFSITFNSPFDLMLIHCRYNYLTAKLTALQIILHKNQYIVFSLYFHKYSKYQKLFQIKSFTY